MNEMRAKADEHAYKEIAKKIVDQSPNFTPAMKTDIKSIIDAGRTPQEIVEATLTYFASLRFH